MVAAENVLLGQLVHCDKSWIRCHCYFLVLGSEFSWPRPIIQRVNFGQVSQISGIERNFFIRSSHDEIFCWLMEVNWNRIARNMPLTKSLSFFAFTVEIIKGLIPAPDQKIRILVLSCYGTPLHAPYWSLELYLIFLFKVTLSKWNCSINCPKGNSLPVRTPAWTEDLLFEFLFRNFLFSRRE